MHIELLSFFATAPGTGGAAAAAVAGDSLIVKDNEGSKKPSILKWWAHQQASGWQQPVFQRGHDTTRNYRLSVTAGSILPLTPQGIALRPNSQEQLLPTIAGSAVAGDVEIGCLLMHYPNLPGVNMNGLTMSEVQRRYICPTSINATIAGAAAGYTGNELVTAESDLLHADTDYAVLGASCNVSCAALWMSGTDFGNCRIAVPGDSLNPDNGQNFFGQLAREFGEPLIPVIKSGNKNSITIGILQNENNVSPIVTWHLAELSKR